MADKLDDETPLFGTEAELDEWSDIVVEHADRLPDPPPEASAAVPEAPKKKSVSQATRLVTIVMDDGAELFRTPDGELYARFLNDGHYENHPLRSPVFRRHMGRMYHKTAHTAPGTKAIMDALLVLEGAASFEAPEYPVHVRIAEHDGNIYLDLGNIDWQAVQITPEGWSIVSAPPVRFRRPKGMAVVPTPIPGGTVDGLRKFVNVATDADFRLLVAWVLSTFHPNGPYPLLVIEAEQGGGKTTTARRVKAIVDPSTPSQRSAPRTEKDLVVGATNAWVNSFDNLSNIPTWLSDALCRLATGGGLGCRELFTNGEEFLFNTKRPAIINGIDSLPSRGDLLDRCITISLPVIPEAMRRTERELDAEFDAALPGITGAFLSVVCGILRDLPATKLDRLPRMADFALWIAAAERSLGWEAGAFGAIYGTNRADHHTLAVESSPIGLKIKELVVTSGGEWSGSAGELLKALTDMFPESQNGRRITPEAWPTNARGMSGGLRRVAPHLREIGIEVETDLRESGTGRRLVVLREKARRSVPKDAELFPSIAETWEVPA